MRRVDFETILANWKDPTPEQLAETARQDAVQAKYRRESRISALDMPITASDFDALLHDQLDMTTKTMAAVCAWLDAEQPWIVLTGSVGRGKTLAAAWALAKRGGRYVGARELERLATARYGDEAESFAAILKLQTLVIDDIGRERDSAGMTSALLDLVDARRKRGQKTIAISNVAKAAFLKQYADERLLSRLSEPGIAVWLADAGPDLRARKP